MIVKVLMLGLATTLPSLAASADSGKLLPTDQLAQAPRIEKINPSGVMRDRAAPRPSQRLREISPLADLKANLMKLEPNSIVFSSRSDSVVVRLVCVIRNIGNQRSTPSKGRLRLEPILRITGTKKLERDIPALDPGKSATISWAFPLKASQLNIRPKLGLRFFWNCEADALPHEKGRFAQNNRERKYHSVKAGYDS